MIPDYDYLMGMAMWSLTAERKEALLKQKGDKHKELDKLRKTTKEELWMADLDELLQKLNEVEAKEKEDESLEIVGKGKKKGGKKAIKEEACPSPHGIRIVPKIAADLREKAVKNQAAKERKANKVARKIEKDIEDEKDEFDDMINDKDANRSLSEKVGLTPEKKKPAAAAKPKVKKEKSSPSEKKSPKKAKKNKKNPWESSDDDENMDSDSDGGGDLSDVAPIGKNCALERCNLLDLNTSYVWESNITISRNFC